MKSLILLAHGSRRKESNEEFRRLSEKVKEQNMPFESVEAAFLELAQPSFEEMVKSLHVKGIQAIAIYPFFLNDGVHVSRDIPNLITQAQTEYPNIEFTLLDYFGKNERFAQIIKEDIVGNN